MKNRVQRTCTKFIRLHTLAQLIPIGYMLWQYERSVVFYFQNIWVCVPVVDIDKYSNLVHVMYFYLQPSRPTPPHLTSIQAEQILASACENEAQNAKRMRLGLEPIAQPNPLNPQPPPQVNLGLLAMQPCILYRNIIFYLLTYS